MFRSLLVLVSLTNTFPVHAELWEGAQNHDRHDMAMGAYFQVYGQSYARPSSFMTFAHFTFGVTDSWQAGTRLGIGMNNPYVGFSSKFSVFGSEGFAVAAFTEVLHQDNFKLSAFPIASYIMGSFEAYVAPVFQIYFTPSFGVIFGVTPGLSLRFAGGLRGYLEGNLNVHGFHNSGSAGLRYFF